jgi:hypothetical protein
MYLKLIERLEKLPKIGLLMRKNNKYSEHFGKFGVGPGRA